MTSQRFNNPVSCCNPHSQRLSTKKKIMFNSFLFFLNLLRLQLKHVNHLETEIQICEKLCHHGAYESAACTEVRPHPETPHPEQVL